MTRIPHGNEYFNKKDIIDTKLDDEGVEVAYYGPKCGPKSTDQHTGNVYLWPGSAEMDLFNRIEINHKAFFLLVMQHGKPNNRDKGWAKRLDSGWSSRSQSSPSDVLDANGDTIIYQNEGPGKLYLCFRNLEKAGFTTELKTSQS